jgi:hypothetical protein
LTLACTPGVASNLAKAPTVEGCDPKSVGGVVSPLIVEWPSNARSDLEHAMHDGVVVVSFTCEKVTVLPDCHVKGEYGYRALTPRTETTLIEGRDNIQASFGGVGWAVAGNLEREAKLDLSFVLVGKMSTTRAAVHRNELEGGDDFCKGATHFVKRADLGAFAFAAGTKVVVGASAKAFGQGGETGSDSKELRTKKDGDQAACKGSKLADGNAPEGCGAGIRVSLAPIKEGGPSKDESVSKKGMSDGLGCPAGFVFVQGACAKDAGGKAYLCAENDEDDCKKQCAAGSDPSCDRYARVLLYRDDEMKDLPSVVAKINAVSPRFEASCAADQPTPCTALALVTFSDVLATGKSPDKVKGLRAFQYMQSACSAGDFVGCAFLRGMADEPDMQTELGVDGKKFFADAITRGCAAGNAVPCGFAAFERAKKDPKGALDLADKACLGSFTDGCLFHAGALTDEATCEKTWSAADPRLHKIYDGSTICEAAGTVSKDAAKAKTLRARACALGAKDACG